MREKMFRGLEIMTGDWVYGSHLKTGTGSEYIVPQNLIANHLPQYAVDKDTVGQYTGLKDKNGREIYEGDVLQPKHSNAKGTYLVVWHNKGFQIEFSFRRMYQGEEYRDKNYVPIYSDSYEVIGNIYDNPELLEETS